MRLEFIVLVLLILLLKILYNLYYFLLAKKYYSEYIKFVKTDSKNWFIRENKQNIIKLFKKAGIKDSHQSNVELAGYGMVSTGNFSVFENLSVLREDIVTIINGDFREAIGVYKQRIFESFNPIYWIETFLYLPKVVLGYLGISSKNFIVKLFQIVWWFITFMSLVIGVIFNKEFRTWLSNFNL